MGIFDLVKSKLFRKKENYSGLRSHVLNEEPPIPPKIEKEFEPAQPGERDYDRFGPPASKAEMDLQRTAMGPNFRERPPPGFEEPIAEFRREPVSFESRPVESANYEVIDRLNMIEAQLSAIRSQTETINERLKNIERRLPRRY